jgi:hypothetical protein
MSVYSLIVSLIAVIIFTLLSQSVIELHVWATVCEVLCFQYMMRRPWTRCDLFLLRNWGAVQSIAYLSLRACICHGLKIDHWRRAPSSTVRTGIFLGVSVRYYAIWAKVGNLPIL